MIDFFKKLFETDFMPHGHCYFWTPEIMWPLAISDSVIALAYLVIPLCLVHIVRVRRDYNYIWMGVLFAIFILGCGTTHVFDVLNIWTPLYQMDVFVRIITAAASIGTAIMLVKITPSIILIPSAETWKNLNAELKGQMSEIEKILEEKIKAEEELFQRTKALEALNKELEAFSYSISHDLRSPLRAIDGFGRKFSDNYGETIDPEGLRLINIMRENSQRMGSMIDSLLDFSRLNRKELNKKEFSMSGLVNSVIEESKQAYPSLKTSFIIKEIKDVNGDKALLHQVWQNLIDNAIKFSQNSPNPEVEIGSFENENEITYYIKDNGTGFNMKYKEKLFGVFQRLHSNAEFEGTGVGLATVQRIIIRHGGAIWADAKLNEGATFFFSLPKS